MLFVSISFALGSQREPSFQWNMGLTENGDLLSLFTDHLCNLTLLAICMATNMPNFALVRVVITD